MLQLNKVVKHLFYFKHVNSLTVSNRAHFWFSLRDSIQLSSVLHAFICFAG